ncbi:biotin-dependent carboxyltransferase family protein [Variovorax sp. KK3]|uniref:5-oxoprolinase subunit C family protein n=1 Tax=Variovorax sp. KK3 TaxID=1855728 RepID=UPI00097BD462|nr:biotin-dependent carboxyltransferase family protein [Variovorax sp. KK3]
MSDATLRITACGPLVSYQDGGRSGMSRFGVPASGPMDRLAHAAAHAALGNLEGSTAIEVSTGGLELVCESGEVTCSIAGGGFQVVHEGMRTQSWCVRTLRAGDTLAIRPGAWGSWAYLAFCGEVLCRTWAGRSATHTTSGLGGGTLSAGDAVVLRHPRVSEEREGPLPVPEFAYARKGVRVVMGPQTEAFAAGSEALFLGHDFTVTPAFDRMGMRLAGPTLALNDALSIPSEPIVRGSIQVAGDGVASVLSADHQTTGGYPKIATIIDADLDSVAQLRPRDGLRFCAVSASEAILIRRSEAPARRRYLEQIAVPQGDLQTRLMRDNLISGVLFS